MHRFLGLPPEILSVGGHIGDLGDLGTFKNTSVTSMSPEDLLETIGSP